MLALVGLFFLPTEYRGGASHSHSHALAQLLLDAQDGRFAHTHAHSGVAASFAHDWLDPAIVGKTASKAHPGPDLGQQQERAPALSMITFLVVIPLLPVMPDGLPRISLETRRLNGRIPRILIPPPKVAVT
jgi:hypothetical protein